jgi:hypothetical protein
MLSDSCRTETVAQLKERPKNRDNIEQIAARQHKALHEYDVTL